MDKSNEGTRFSDKIFSSASKRTDMAAGGTLFGEVEEWTCTLCGKETLSRKAAVDHLANRSDQDHSIEVIFQTPEGDDDRGVCGFCGKESTLQGLEQHCRDKFNHPTDLPRLFIDSTDKAESELPLEAETMIYCPKCETTAQTIEALRDHQCIAFNSAAQHVQSLHQPADSGEESTAGTPSESPAMDHPDVVANQLLENEGEPVRVYLNDGELTTPTEPYRSGTPETTTVPARAFDAVVKRCHNEDGGLTISGTLHLPQTEWDRLGLGKHWEAEDADTVGHQRHLELWASREKSMESGGYQEELYQVPDSINEDDPILNPYREHAEKERVPDSPISPLEPMKLTLRVAHAEGSSRRSHGLDRLEVGRIARIEPLEEMEHEPERREETYDFPDSPPSTRSRHPTIDYEEMEPLPATSEILDALYTINRVAKRHGKKGDDAYRRDDGAQAKVHSVKKHALYDTKTVALHRLAVGHPDSLTITRHELDDKDYWLFDFGDHSFHQPARAVADELLEDYGIGGDDSDAKSIEYDPNPGSQDLPLDIEEALGYLLEHGIDANKYLSQTSVTEYGWGSVQLTHDTSWQITAPSVE